MNKTCLHTLCVALLALLTTACSSQPKDELDKAIENLENAIALRNDVASLKEEHIDIHKRTLDIEGLDYPQKMEHIEAIVGLYDKYQLDSTLVWLNHGIRLSEKSGDGDKVAQLRLHTSQKYSAAGFYDEAYEMLLSVDTTQLSPKTQQAYYLAAHSYHREMREYSPDKTIRERSAHKEVYYIDRLIDSEDDYIEKHKLLCTKYSNNSDWEALTEELEIVLPTLSPDSQDFAYFSYLKALSVGDDRGTPEEFMTYLARSASADMRTCTTDHASLCMLSEMLFYQGDVERAFRYIQIAMTDATSYNSRLRPWQVATLMPVIEKSYSDRIHKQQMHLTGAVITISLLFVALLIFLVQKMRRTRQLRIASQKLEEMNRQLEEYIALLSQQNAKERQLSADLSEANAVKEQYIGLFLVICSNYIDQFKSFHNKVRKKLSKGSIESLQAELDSSPIFEEAEKEFYANFDNAFLNLYPTFVSDFNALLKEEAQITLKNPRTLNTEMRIFALIKLGITDSSRIASLLRYSVNTIYNYRAGVKNNARYSRDDFEESVRKIGSKGDSTTLE